MHEKLYIIDTTSPFFVKHPRTLINWSKVPHHHLEKKDGLPHKKRQKKIRSNFERYVRRAADLGYNSISVDELSRVALLDFYPPELRKKIKRWRKYYRRLFQIAARLKMRIFLTTDLMFFHPAIEEATQNREGRLIEVLKAAIEDVLAEFPEIAGIIFRAGESDGVDVKGDFRSRIVLRTPAQANRWIHELLPLFESRKRYMIFRTWSVGAYRIGDLMWNPRTYRRVFRGTGASEYFIVSMKYGESDFFRYLKLNPHFLRGPEKKLIELQTRREYEGFGEFPSFTGREYRRYYKQLREAQGIAGIHVWAQTGGWSHFRNFTFLKNTSYWNELNTAVTLRIFRDGATVKEAASEFYRANAAQSSPNEKDVRKFLKFLRLSDRVIRELLYDPEFAPRELYVHRSRVPPLLHIFWDNVTISDHFVTLYNLFVSRKGARRSVTAGRKALDRIGKMRKIAHELKLPYDARFHYDTFRLLSLCREVIYAKEGSKRRAKVLRRIEKDLPRYHAAYPGTYKFFVQVSPERRGFFLRLFLRVAMRQRARYRFLDYVLFNGIMARLYLLIFRMLRHRFPEFLDNRGMPVEKILS